MKKSRILSLFVVSVMLFSLLPAAVSHGAAFSDTGGHWAESYINRAVADGIAQGYPDGSFRPNNSVTRAEFISMVNKLLKNTAAAGINFYDVPQGSWYYNDIAKGVAAAYVSESGSFLPNNPITRQEAAVIISKIVPTYGSTGNLSAYSDAGLIPSWAYSAFQKVNGKGYLGAYADGRLHPADNLTRAQAAKIMCDISSNETIITSNTVVSTTGDAQLSGAVYSNGVTIHPNLGNGNAFIENCVILGSLNVNGGGSNSVTVSNSKVTNVVVDKAASAVRLAINGETSVASLSAARTATIQSSGVTGDGISSLNIRSSSNITLSGSFPRVTVEGAGARLNLNTGTISYLNVSGAARNSEITVNSSASVSTADVNAAASFRGTGNISVMTVYANGVTYEKKPSSVRSGSGYTTPESDEDDDVTFSPRDGARNVSRTATVRITFPSAMKMYDGSTLTDADVEDFVSLREGSSSGSRVYFEADVSTSKRVITLTPDYDFERNTTYYVVLSRNQLKDSDGNGNMSRTVSFSTGSTLDGGTGDGGVLFDPADGDTGVSRNIEPVIEFDEPVITYDGEIVDRDHLADAIVFRDETADRRVSFTASINYAKDVITVTPRSELTDEHEYYLGISSRQFRYKDSNDVLSSESATWLVGRPRPALSSVSAAADSNAVTVSATPNTAGTLYAAIIKSGGSAPTTVDGVRALAGSTSSDVRSGTSASFKFEGLEAGTAYTCYLVLRANNTDSSVYSRGASTTSGSTPSTPSTPPPAVQAAALNGITVTGGTLSPAFKSDVRNYEIKLPFAESGSVVLTPEKPENAALRASLNGTRVTPPIQVDVRRENPSASVAFEVIEDGKTNSTYTVSVKLGGLTGVDVAGSDIYDRTPSQLLVPAIDTTALTITAEDPNAIITYNQSTGTGVLEVKDIPLTAPSTEFTFTVTSNSDITTYKYTILRD